MKMKPMILHQFTRLLNIMAWAILVDNIFWSDYLEFREEYFSC